MTETRSPADGGPPGHRGPRPTFALASLSIGTWARRLPRSASAIFGVVSLVVAAVILGRIIDGDAVRESVRAMAVNPGAVAIALAAFGAAFVVRAALWTRVLPGLPFRQALAALHLALGANHVLPLRLGEPLRVVSVLRRTPVGVAAATSSSIALRSIDIVAMAVLGWTLAPAAFGHLLGGWAAAVLAVVLGAGALATVWLHRTRAAGTDAIRLPGPVVAVGSMVAWVLEAVLVWQSARFAGIDLSFHHAVLVTTAAITAQTVAVTPGGLGTYEAASVVAYTSLGHDPGPALVAALTAHALKTAYSLVAGGVAVFVPQPSLVGRVRLRRRRPDLTAPPEPPDLATRDLRSRPAPVVVFFPAHDEEATVASVVRRCPAEVLGHPVEVLVIDDGSTDRTAERASAAGATVCAMGRNHGLGAAVRRGLAESIERGAAAVVFLDADGEYAPEELERLVAPILAGAADYVVGSRFDGEIRSMRPHRRAGNIVLTRLLSFIARRRISDGQSGYRALSPLAAGAAEIVHDFNYAQVLTLDLLAKGCRYVEVPITYGFRTEGTSFVRLGRYLRHVVPAVYRELNDQPAAA